MEALDFRELATLINRSKTTEIDIDRPLVGAGAWELYQARHRVHTSTYPFTVLYLPSRVTRDGVDAALRTIPRDSQVHVVFPPSLENRVAGLREAFGWTAGVWSTKDYLSSFIRDELLTYRSKIEEQSPPYYIDPPVEVPAGMRRRIPNPLRSLLLDRDPGTGDRDGAIGILLAEPGQGKTYMCRYLASQVAASKQNLMPLMIDSSQWQAMSVEDQSSLWKTVAHSFRHFGAPIGWLDGNEELFVGTTLKADLFRIIFDGFDEYILRNRGAVQPLEVLHTLAELAERTGARIILTSRTSFWATNLSPEDTKAFIDESGALLYTILPFDREHAENYFTTRLNHDGGRVAQAVGAYQRLRHEASDLVGRGFVLNLIADFVERSGDGAEIRLDGANAVGSLILALCQRETLRQQLPYSADEQLAVFRTFASETAVGNKPNTELLTLVLEEVKPELDGTTRRSVVEKLRSHPLISSDVVTDTWRFREEQVAVLLLAERIVGASDLDLARFVERVRFDAALRQDLATMAVQLEESGGPDWQARIQRLVVIMSTCGDTDAENALLGEGPRLAAVIALRAADRALGAGSAHHERGRLLVALSGGEQICGMTFTGTVGRYDLRGVQFVRCRFEKVTWANCTFDETSLFQRCQFAGGAAGSHTKGLGAAQFEDSTLDEEASAFVSHARVDEGRKRYTQEDLRADMHALIKKFVVRGGPGLRTVHEKDLLKGAIGSSRYKDEILDVMKSLVFETHHISGTSGDGFHIRDGASEAVRFYAANNVMTGPLAEAFERLRRKVRPT